ncbi:metal-dependent transcriptional regulator [soil metagenome]
MSPASTETVSEHLSVAPASVSSMFGRLREMGFVEYERYHGAFLTERGLEEALRLVRRHRLIESFLLEYLSYSWEEVHEEAERLEHAVSDEFTERLAEMLGHPERDLHGDPIPRTDGTLDQVASRPLTETTDGDCVRISHVDHEDASTLGFLEKRGLVPGRLLKVQEIRTVDGVVAVEDESGNSHSLGQPLADLLFIQSLSESDNQSGEQRHDGGTLAR